MEKERKEMDKEENNHNNVFFYKLKLFKKLNFYIKAVIFNFIL